MPHKSDSLDPHAHFVVVVPSAAYLLFACSPSRFVGVFFFHTFLLISISIKLHGWQFQTRQKLTEQHFSSTFFSSSVPTWCAFSSATKYPLKIAKRKEMLHTQKKSSHHLDFSVHVRLMCVCVYEYFLANSHSFIHLFFFFLSLSLRFLCCHSIWTANSQINGIEHKQRYDNNSIKSTFRSRGIFFWAPVATALFQSRNYRICSLSYSIHVSEKHLDSEQ